MLFQRLLLLPLEISCQLHSSMRVSGNMQHGGYPPEGFGFFSKTSISLSEFLTASLFHPALHTLYRTTDDGNRLSLPPSASARNGCPGRCTARRKLLFVRSLPSGLPS